MEARVTTTDGVSLAVLLDLPEDSDDPFPAVLFVHGYGSHKVSYDYRHIGPALREQGIATVCFDFRGSGESAGNVQDVTTSTGLIDIAAVMAWLHSQPQIDSTRLGIFGFSYGGLISTLYLESHDDFRAAVLKAPASDWAGARRKRLGPSLMADWKQNGWHDFEYPGLTVRAPYKVYQDALQYDVYANAAKIACPVLIFHGDHDESVPVEQSDRLAHAIGPQASFHLLPGADHRFYASDDFAILRDQSTNFFASQLL